MEQRYSIFVINDRYKYVKPAQVSIFLLLAFIFTLLGYYTNDSSGYLWSALLIVSTICILHEKRLQQYRFFRFANFTETGFLWAIFASYLLIAWWMALLVTAVALSRLLIKKNIEIQFTDEYIHCNTIPVQQIPWQQLQNVVIKDGLLTIDRINNKITQATVNTEMTGLPDELIFNEFCRQMIIAHQQTANK